MRRKSSGRSVSIHTQVKMEDAPSLLKIQSQNVQIFFGYVYQNTHGRNHGPVWKIQSFLLNGICTAILRQDCVWERQFEKALLEPGWDKVPNWECFFVSRERGLFLSVYVDDLKQAGKKQNIDPMWKRLMKEKSIECETSKDIVDIQRHV